MSIATRLQNGVTRGHVALYRATGGRVGTRFRGAPVLLLDHVGRRSGAHRTTPLMYLRDGEDFVIVASNGGARSHPAWFHNIAAAGQATVQVGPERQPVDVHTADDAERERLWPGVVGIYSSYEDYQRKTDRQIPVVVLTPR